MPRLSVLTSLYRGSRYLPHFLENLAAQSMFGELELVLVHNEPSDEELGLLRSFQERYPEHIQHLVVPSVEPLGASWNRAWLAARGDYLAIWNVDDRRTPDSLANQVAALEKHPEIVMTYGDFITSLEYGEEAGSLYKPPDYNPRRFRREFPQRGAFLVFHKSIADRVGYFDEQLKIAPDFELSLRIAFHGLRMSKVHGLLGYFTNAEQGLSTRDGAQQAVIERTFLQQRYAIYDKVRSEYLAAARAYRLEELLNFGAWQPLSDYLTNHAAYLRVRRPLWILGWLRNTLRSIFQRMGILQAVYRLQDRYIGREV